MTKNPKLERRDYILELHPLYLELRPHLWELRPHLWELHSLSMRVTPPAYDTRSSSHLLRASPKLCRLFMLPRVLSLALAKALLAVPRSPLSLMKSSIYTTMRVNGTVRERLGRRYTYYTIHIHIHNYTHVHIFIAVFKTNILLCLLIQ